MCFIVNKMKHGRWKSSNFKNSIIQSSFFLCHKILICFLLLDISEDGQVKWFKLIIIIREHVCARQWRCCPVSHSNVFLSVSVAWVVWIEHPLYEAIETDDSGIGNTAITFVFLFLITLFYSIGATFVKVYNFLVFYS